MPRQCLPWTVLILAKDTQGSFQNNALEGIKN